MAMTYILELLAEAAFDCAWHCVLFALKDTPPSERGLVKIEGEIVLAEPAVDRLRRISA
jgi:hypothetical protein